MKGFPETLLYEGIHIKSFRKPSTTIHTLHSLKSVSANQELSPPGESRYHPAFLACLAFDARRFSFRFFAAARDAFLARAERSSGVMVSRLLLPPILPPLRPSSRMISESSAFFLLSMRSILSGIRIANPSLLASEKWPASHKTDALI